MNAGRADISLYHLSKLESAGLSGTSWRNLYAIIPTGTSPIENAAPAT